MDEERMARIADAVRDFVFKHPDFDPMNDRFIFSIDTDHEGLISSDGHCCEHQVMNDLIGHLRQVGSMCGTNVDTLMVPRVPDTIEGIEDIGGMS